MAEISEEDYKCIRERRAHDVKDEECQAVIYDLANDFSLIIPWIEQGIAVLRESQDVPEVFKPPELRMTDAMKQTWSDFYMGTFTRLGALKEACEAFVVDMDERMEQFEQESTGSYSSYSDYSEDTEQSDDETDESESESEEEESPQPRKRKR